MQLPLGAAMEDEVESRTKKYFVYTVDPQDGVIDFELQ
eukprot:SAG11_NODE_36467_length_261_cov_0.950617_1_plen_37_part_01